MLVIRCNTLQYRRNVRKLAALWGDREDDWGVWEAGDFCLLYMEGEVTY